jgi:hypothetical protein
LIEPGGAHWHSTTVIPGMAVSPFDPACASVAREEVPAFVDMELVGNAGGDCCRVRRRFFVIYSLPESATRRDLNFRGAMQHRIFST